MRVRLSYSVELEDVPESVAQLIEDEAGHLSYCDHAIDEINSLLREADPSVESALKKIDRVRQILGSLDQRLNECEGILQGYSNAINQPAAPQPQPDTPPQPARVYESTLPYNVVANEESPEDAQVEEEEE